MHTFISHISKVTAERIGYSSSSDNMNNNMDDSDNSDDNNNIAVLNNNNEGTAGEENDIDGAEAENNNNGDENYVDHDRLTSLSNYNYDRPIGLMDLDNGLQQIREEARQQGQQRMVSFMDLEEDPEIYEGTGLNLSWGEYYVPHEEMNSDDESSCSSEAEEIAEDEAEEEQLHSALAMQCAINAESNSSFQLDNGKVPPDLSLLGMPDILLERILHYTIYASSDVCVLERVCKRIHGMTTSNDDFWARRASLISSNRRPEFFATTREMALKMGGLRSIRKYQKYQKKTTNVIIDVLKDEMEDECVASTVRTLSANILSRMNSFGQTVQFRIRGDSIGYLCELVQGYMIDRLEIALLLSVRTVNGGVHYSTQPPPVIVQRRDVALAFQPHVFHSFESFHSLCKRNPISCNLDKHDHGQLTSHLDCSCSLPSLSGTVWRWPNDNCQGLLAPEIGRRIIRRLAYMAGVLQMSNDAFVFAEAVLIHTMGVLLVDSYESSVKSESANSRVYLGEEEELTYETPTDGVDMFITPPPSFYDHGKEDTIDSSTIETSRHIYTIVPGQISTAAESRSIIPSKVYGNVWVASSGFTQDEEMKIERSYYYDDILSSSDNETGHDKKDDSSITTRGSEHDDTIIDGEDEDEDESDNDSKISWSESKSEEDSVMDMDDYCFQSLTLCSRGVDGNGRPFSFFL